MANETARVIVYPKGADIKLSDHFHLKEFEDDLVDGSNHFTLIDPFLMILMEQIRVAVGQPVYITSGFRTAAKNKMIGGATTSYHTKGMAADWTVADPQFELDTFWKILSTDKLSHFRMMGGTGLYLNRGFIHVDTRRRDAVENKVIAWEGI